LIDRKPIARPARAVREILRRFGRIGRAEFAALRSSVGARDLATILASLSAVHADARTWVVHDRRAGEPELMFIGPRGGLPSAIVRVARSSPGQSGLARAREALQALHVRLAVTPSVARVIPTILAYGELEGASWLAESAFSGRSGRELLSDPVRRRAVLEATAIAIDAIHAATARETVVGDTEIARWVTDRVRVVSELQTGTNVWRASSGTLAALTSIASSVEARIRGRPMTTSWIHGDLWPANVLLGSDAGAQIGIVDWDSAQPDELPLQDQLHLAITSRRIVNHKDLGTVVADLLGGGSWTLDDRIALGGRAGASPHGPDLLTEGRGGLPSATAVESNLARHPELATDRTWVAGNVERVLLCA
jgi:Phosphotransferase enzyme family